MRRAPPPSAANPQTVTMSRRAMILGSAATVAGCSSQVSLVNAPTVFADGNGYPVDGVTPSQRTATAPLFFVTDRALTHGNTFGSDRSLSTSYGEYVVNIGPEGTTWDDLLSQGQGVEQRLPMSTKSITIEGTLPATPVPFTVRNGSPAVIEELRNEYERALAHSQAALAKQITASGSGDVLVLIPGVNTSFDEGAFQLAEVWHHSGRASVPVLYSWPSGRGGLVGYFTDRESGDFSIFHLKEFIKSLARMPEVERVHILAHSRGTSVATTALRELIIADRAAGNDPYETYKVENLILAAADLNFDVVSQRLIAEKLGPAFGQVTAYTNQGDGALALAQSLMNGARFGRLNPDQLAPNVREVFNNIRNVNFIQVEDGGGFVGHSYYRLNPDVLSDIVMLLRSCARPGTPQRPLARIGDGNFWLLPNGYLAGVNPSLTGCGPI